MVITTRYADLGNTRSVLMAFSGFLEFLNLTMLQITGLLGIEKVLFSSRFLIIPFQSYPSLWGEYNIFFESHPIALGNFVVPPPFSHS
jgi:hypothetical protein